MSKNPWPHERSRPILNPGEMPPLDPLGMMNDPDAPSGWPQSRYSDPASDQTPIVRRKLHVDPLEHFVAAPTIDQGEIARLYGPDAVAEVMLRRLATQSETDAAARRKAAQLADARHRSNEGLAKARAVRTAMRKQSKGG